MSKINAINKIGTTIKKLSGKPLGTASKILGAATLASVVYDAHVNGKERAKSTDILESGTDFYNNYSQYMTMEKESATIAKLKGVWFDIKQNNPFRHMAPQSKGYAQGAGSTLLKALPLIGLSAAALKFKKVGKAAGVLLAAAAAKTVFYDVIGKGCSKQIK